MPVSMVVDRRIGRAYQSGLAHGDERFSQMSAVRIYLPSMAGGRVRRFDRGRRGRRRRQRTDEIEERVAARQPHPGYRRSTSPPRAPRIDRVRFRDGDRRGGRGTIGTEFASGPSDGRTPQRIGRYGSRRMEAVHSRSHAVLDVREGSGPHQRRGLLLRRRGEGRHSTPRMPLSRAGIGIGIGFDHLSRFLQGGYGTGTNDAGRRRGYQIVTHRQGRRRVRFGGNRDRMGQFDDEAHIAAPVTIGDRI
mmetsp:Transcript_21398/g.62542  ORF Transcript_21398/g.62542 Transcript_21398/m.62542 type:complete len:248 (-) Transcript_21398:5044-5787(-)